MNRELLDNLGIKINSIKKIGKVTVINDKYVMKDIKRNDNFYEYLLTRKFNYFPKIYNSISNIELMEYISDKDVPSEQRLEDIAYLTSILHLNTSFDKVVDLDSIKEIYESTIDKLTDLSNYYLDLQNVIEEEEFMSPANYLLIRNMSLIYKSINKSKMYLEKWYKEVEKNKSIRYVYTHGNLRNSHLLENDNLYLISWDNSKIDLPVKDIEILYRNSHFDISLKDILKVYEIKYPLKKEEKYLLYANILIPDKIACDQDEFSKINRVSDLIFYLEDTIALENDSKETYNNTNK